MQIKYINRYPDAIVVGVWISSFRSTIRSNTILSCSAFSVHSFSLLLLSLPHQLRSSPFAAATATPVAAVTIIREMVIVNVYDSVCWFGCAHQKLDKLLYYFGFCAWDLFCVFCSMNCFQTSEFNSLALTVCVCVCLCLFSHFLSLFLHRLLRRRSMALFFLHSCATVVLSLLSLFPLF